jgi:hypothetical protein
MVDLPQVDMGLLQADMDLPLVAMEHRRVDMVAVVATEHLLAAMAVAVVVATERLLAAMAVAVVVAMEHLPAAMVVAVVVAMEHLPADTDNNKLNRFIKKRQG